MYVPVSLAITFVLLVLVLVVLLAWAMSLLIQRELRKPSNLSDEDVERIKRSLDKTLMENARRREAMLDELSRN
jgi:Na+-transporting methylmalonyl-CoA/oxaloacetate decarboxylase gamma subunit